MNVLISDLVNLTHMYEECRELASYFGKVIIMKNEQPDSVLLPIDEYERLSTVFEKSDDINKIGVVNFVKRLPSAGKREVYTLAQLKYDLDVSNEKMYRCKNK